MKPDKTIKKLHSGIPVTVVALGDSLTYGWMVSKGYLDYLEDFLVKKFPKCKLNIINKGIPGDTAFSGLNRLAKDVIKNNPDLILIQFSLNDAFLGYSPIEFGEHTQEIVNIIKSYIDSEIIILTSNYLINVMDKDIINNFYNMLEKIATINKIPIVKVHEYWKRNIVNDAQYGTYVQNDCVHPNEDGYRLMAEAIMELFINSD